MQKEHISFENGKPSTLLRHNFLEQLKGITAVTFTRNYDEQNELNLSSSTGEEENHVMVERFFNCKAMIRPMMTHSTEIAVIDRIPHEFFEPCDGVITNLSQVALMITHADCQAALIYDPVSRWIGAVHAGWRGQSGGIYTKAIQTLMALGAKKENLYVSISPSLGILHSEFVNYEKEFPPSLWKYRNNTHFDLWTMAEDEFISLGIPKENIYVSRICTYENKELFFSYRRDKTRSRNGSGIMLTDLSGSS